MDSLKDKITGWIQPKLQELNCFLVDIKVIAAGNKIEVYIDNMEGIKISMCETVSRYLELHLDNDPSVPAHYILEVSSPGMDNPFRIKQQYVKNIGKTVEVLLHNGIKKEGILLSVNEDAMQIQIMKPSKAKGQKNEVAEEKLFFNEIKNTKKKITFN